MGKIMNRVIDNRVDALFREKDHHQEARFLMIRKDDLMSGLPQEKNFATCYEIDEGDSEMRSLAKLKRLLRWDDDEEREEFEIGVYNIEICCDTEQSKLCS